MQTWSKLSGRWHLSARLILNTCFLVLAGFVPTHREWSLYRVYLVSYTSKPYMNRLQAFLSNTTLANSYNDLLMYVTTFPCSHSNFPPNRTWRTLQSYDSLIDWIIKNCFYTHMCLYLILETILSYPQKLP